APNTVCVNNTRCSIPVCYPINRASSQWCPPLTSRISIISTDSTTMITTRSALSIATTSLTPTPSVTTKISTTPRTTKLSARSTNVVATTTFVPSRWSNTT
ncbi:unnamed protein product, partial [Rotaria sordida]